MLKNVQVTHKKARKKQRSEKQRDKQKTNTKWQNLSSNTSMINLNKPIKRDQLFFRSWKKIKNRQ